MSQIIYPITHLPPVIDIGKQTEKGVTRIGFDVHEWLDDWPGMVFSVQPTRPGETESYFADTEMVGSVVFWLVGATDTERAGSGTVEVLGVTEDERKLSFMCRTSIANTNTATAAEIPEPNQPWVDQVILAGESAKEDAQAAAQSAKEASQAATEAEQSAASAKANAEKAEQNAVDVFVARFDNNTYTSAPGYDEITEARSAGKSCIIIDSYGKVFTYIDKRKYEDGYAHYFASSPYSGTNTTGTYGIIVEGIYVKQDSKIVASRGYPATTPNPAKLKLTGAVEAEYDGSKQVEVPILPTTADPLKQLITDKDGNVAWEDRLAYKYTSTEKGYAYVYQDAEMASADGQYLLPAPPVASPVAGETYTVIIGSNEYTSKCVDASVLMDGLESYVFGNTAAMGDELPIENPDPDATYIILLVPGGSDGFYGVLMSDDSVESPTLTIRSTEEIETTTTNLKKVDRELLDVPTPDMQAGYDEEGYIKNRPCWVYETQKGGIVWDGVIEGKEALYMTMNGTTQLLGYKVCPVPMDEHTFVNKLRSWSYAYPYNEDGSSAGTKKIIDKREFVTYGLYAIRATGGNVLYYSYVAENTGDSLATFSGGGTGVYITPEFAATAPRIEWVTGDIYKPLDKKLLPPARTDTTATNTVYYWRWNPSSGEWQAVTIDQLKADLGLT